MRLLDGYRPRPLELERLPIEIALERSRAFLALMQTRRSIRHFSPQPVEPDLIENAIRTAGSAPSGANQQPWTFVVVTSEQTKRALREAAEREEKLLYRERASDEYLEAIRPIGTNAVKPHVTDAPVLIVVFEQPWRIEDGEKRKHYYVRESVGIAVGLLIASLHAAGLATLTHAPSPMGFHWAWWEPLASLPQAKSFTAMPRRWLPVILKLSIQPPRPPSIIA